MIDRKALGDVEVSPMLVQQITVQLRTRIVQEFQNLMGKRDVETGIFEPVADKGIEGSDLQQRVIALLDLSKGESALDGQTATPISSASDAPLNYPDSYTGTQGTAYPIYKINSLFPPEESSIIRQTMNRFVPTNGKVALCYPRSLAAHGAADPVPLGLALWRLRLWNGYAWTVPSADTSILSTGVTRNTSPKGDRINNFTIGEVVRCLQDEERMRGRVVQGFKTVEDVLHAKWP